MNLIICQSPLQILIAEKIIATYPNDVFYGLMICCIENSKYQYYYQRLKSKCEKCELIYTHKPYKKWVFYKLVFKRLFKLHNLSQVKKIFLTNTTAEIMQIYIGDAKNADIITFDDGLANINIEDNFLIRERPLRSRTKFLQYFMRIPTVKDILAKQVKHYSIYNLPNIMGKYEKISLFETPNYEQDYNEVVNILLGQPIYENSKNGEQRNIALIEKVFTNYHIDFYYPHPRENYKINQAPYINTKLIFEDWIIQQTQKYPQKQYRLYTFFSSAAINLIDMPNIEVIALNPKDCPENFLPLYTIFKKLNIEVKNI
ncbi:glycosyltransferase family 52 [Pasteurella atlantica]|uniref:glycosyltransferase family 52 n=1 Tax=Pasteurellaceae TaxID=712 RepID=UPI0027623026|nr:glycosyltransferase family 52 [Pasteurella atlantica]MDP8033191.1 glycosyltransferase family 52 [Pasteurella atlantica]MDP8035259.1 glycosyltransferase family 52 [Pasteurella atlantica]MDP8037209.1 glycosyltransferase family 52 [Pasteurella atlantica]MDP8047396.1 glycosyltransferase family 52 [Pasteurella atlantica]MDP8049380.1 glycosyltransferase family 52 [Pasteurella atlantica]